MIRILLLEALLTVIALEAQSQNAEVKGSISGIVQDAVNRTPIANADVFVGRGKSTKTDDKGRYELRDLRPGIYTVYAYPGEGRGPHGSKVVRLSTGQALTVDVQVVPNATISGRVLDENGEPSPETEVYLIGREYRQGSLHYVYVGMANTDDRGQYELKYVKPGLGFLLEAVKLNRKLSALSDAPADPRLRKKVPLPTWYPDSDAMDASQMMVFQPGEHREQLDLRLKRSVSYCFDGVLATDNGPAALAFVLQEWEPTSGEFGDGGMFIAAPYGKAGDDGKVRVCDLHKGRYRLTTFNDDQSFFGETEVTIGDKDVHGVRAFGHARLAIAGEVLWDGKPADGTTGAKVNVWIRPLTRAPFGSEFSSTRNAEAVSVPGQFRLPGLLVDDYRVTVRGVPAGAYLKDIVYGGQSDLHAPMRVGKTMGSDLRIVLGTDGGTVKVAVADKDKNPVPDCQIVLFPETASTEVDLADAMVQGGTDQYGGYTTNHIAPGRYYVLATNGSIDRTPETITKLLQARTHAQEIVLQAGGSAQVTVLPMELGN